MIPQINFSFDEVIKHATSAERVLWAEARLICGERAAIQQFYYIGPVATPLFETYSVNRLWFALEYEGGLNEPVQVGPTVHYFYNQFNALGAVYRDDAVVWNTTSAAVNYLRKAPQVRNILFSRVNTDFIYIKFIGYKITY